MRLDLKNFIGNEQFDSKFVRLGNEIYVTSPNDLTTFHYQLAEEHKIKDKILNLKEQNPDEVDGGIIHVSGKIIRFSSASSSLGIPLTKKARALTIQKLEDRFPTYSIKELID